MKLFKESASKIKSFKMCEFKYALEYHFGLQMAKNFAAEQGSLIHSVFETFGKAIKSGQPRPTNWLDIVIKSYHDGLWKLSKKAPDRAKDCENCEHYNKGSCFIVGQDITKFKGCPRDEFAECLKLIEGVIYDKSPNNPLNKKIIDVENRFNITVGDENIPVNGIIDVVTEQDADTIEIWDYKTGSFQMSYDECKTDPQLLMYHLAGRKIYPQYKNILVTIFYLQDKPMTFAFSEKDERGTTMALVHYWHKIRNNICPRRRCDRQDGTVNFDWKCKAMCSPELCGQQYKKFIADGGALVE